MTDTETVVVITGGASGIGLAIARRAAASGGAVVLLDRTETSLQAAVKGIETMGGKAYGFVLDVSDQAATRDIAATIEANVGQVTGLVTCAGVTSPAPAESMSRDVWRHVLDINLDGTFYSCQAFAAGMLKRRRGSIVTISSVSGLGGQSGRVNYVASKWAVIGLTKSLAIEWGQRGIRANCIAPGPIDTPLFQKLPAEFREKVIVSRTPQARVAQTDEVAQAALFLLSDAASFVNGAVLPVDGGYSSGFSTFQSGTDLAS